MPINLHLRLSIYHLTLYLYTYFIYRITTNGQASTITTQSLSSSTVVSSTTNSSSDNNNHTGAIVGGVIGGVVALSALVLLAWFLRRRRRQDEFDGNFDPDRVTRHDSSALKHGGRADADLLAAAAETHSPEVTPYTYGLNNAAPSLGSGNQGMQMPMAQHNGMGASYLGPGIVGAGVGAAAGYGANYDRKGGGSLSPVSYYDPNAPPMPSGPSETGSGSGSGSGHAGFNQSQYSGPTPYGMSPYAPVGVTGVGRPGPPSSTAPSVYSQSLSGHQPSVSGTGGYVPNAKEREAFASRYAQQMGQGQGTPYDPNNNGSAAYVSPYSAAGGSGYGEGSAPLTLRNPSTVDDGAESPSVVVHQDGGRVRDEEGDMALNEIPPTYDSIRSDEDENVPRAR